MGTCFKKPPVNAEAKENICCDNDSCPSSCCVIIIRPKDSPLQRATNVEDIHHRQIELNKI